MCTHSINERHSLNRTNVYYWLFKRLIIYHCLGPLFHICNNIKTCIFCTDTTVVIKCMYLKTLCHLYHTFYSEASQSAYLRIQSITINHQRTRSCIDNNCIYYSMRIFLNKCSLTAAFLHLTPQTVYLRIHPININHQHTHSYMDRTHV